MQGERAGVKVDSMYQALVLQSAGALDQALTFV